MCQSISPYLAANLVDHCGRAGPNGLWVSDIAYWTPTVAAVGRWGVDGHERGPAARRARRRREEAVDAALVVVFIPQLEHGEEELVRPRPVPVEVLETKQTQEVEVGPAPLQTFPRLVQRAGTCVHVPRWCIRRVSYR